MLTKPIIDLSHALLIMTETPVSACKINNCLFVLIITSFYSDIRH